MGALRYLPIKSATPDEIMTSDSTIKGKREGMTVLAQSKRPSVTYSIAIFEFLKKRAKIKHSIAEVIKLCAALFFGEFVLEVIVRSPLT